MRRLRDWRGSSGGKNGCNFYRHELAVLFHSKVTMKGINVHFESLPDPKLQIAETVPTLHSVFVSFDSVAHPW